MTTESTQQYAKPIPDMTRDIPFWEGMKRHEFRLYKCQNCGNTYYPEQKCFKCGNPKMEWVPASGKGKVYTFIIMHQLYNPAFQQDVPYNVSIIELDEGPMIMSNVAGCKNEDIKIGMPVEVVFEDVTPEVTIHKFKPI